MLTGREKIYFVVNSIFNKSQTTPKNKPITLNRALDLNNRIPTEELKDIMQILEKDEGVIAMERKIEKAAQYMFNDRIGTYVFDLTTRFETYFRMMQKEDEYMDFTGKRPRQIVTTESSVDNVFWIEYSPKRNILLNGYLEIGKPTLGNENDLVFDYLYQHPNKIIQREEIEKGINQTIKKDLDKIVDNLGFKRGLGKLFFEASKTTILFRNPISKSTLDEMKLGILDAKLK